jgi:cell division protein FtsB
VRRAAWPLLVAVLFAVAILFLAVFPARTLMAQRHQRAQVEAQLTKLQASNKAMQERVKLLGTDAEIERLAREQYDLVRPGEQAFAVLPGPKPQAPAPPRKKVAHHRSLFQKVVHAVF